MRASDSEVIGLIPAGGRAMRIAPLPCSKELYPVGFQADEGGFRPKVICQYLLEKMRLAGISRVYILLRAEKWDIPAYFGDGSKLGMHLAYITVGTTAGVPFTVDKAYPFLRNANVVFGFPDILFEPENGFSRLLAKRAHGGADLTLGLFPARDPSIEDLIEAGEDGRVKDVAIPPARSLLRDTWGIAAWGPVFTEYIHQFALSRKDIAQNSSELIAGHVIQAAVRDGLEVEAIRISETPYLDIGTPEGLFEAVRRGSQRNT